MSYTTGTTHYNLPQTVGSDKRDWTDTNEAFNDVDAALWEAHQGATQAALDIASINSEIQTITGKQADDEADIAAISGKVSTLETTVGNHTTEIGDVRRDLQDNIESLREDTATSTHAYEIGDYFYYNDVLFKATAQIAIGATIVPNTNCTGVTVMDELKNVSPTPGAVTAEDVSYDNTTSGLTADDVQEAIDEVVSRLPSAGSWTSLTSSNGAVEYKKEGNVVTLSFNVNGSVASYATLATLPAEIRPHVQTGQVVLYGYEAGSTSTFVTYNSSTGELSAMNSATTTSGGLITYLI